MLVVMRVGSKVPAPYLSCSNVLAATKVLGQATAKNGSSNQEQNFILPYYLE